MTMDDPSHVACPVCKGNVIDTDDLTITDSLLVEICLRLDALKDAIEETNRI